MNTVATPCMIAVPSIFIVVPKGIQKELTDLSTPNFSSTVFKVTGMVALLEEVLKAKIIASLIFVKKTKGLIFAKEVSNKL